ncbi:MAG: phosphoribosyltransferase [Desulfohalobiaceae bacterium]|nr:phosphoribosyltransferase [Desulfohalobiaceae bacterium]
MDNVHEMPEHRNGSGIFQDRSDAGAHLARMLHPFFAKDPTSIVLAIPSGGVPVGLVLSRRLGLDFDLVLVRKVQIPWNTEAGFGAVAFRGRTLLNKQLVASLRLSQEQIQEQVENTRQELEERNNAFRGGSPPPDLTRKTVILTDDGLASGYTMLAAMETTREMGAKKVVLALPTAPRRSLEHVAPYADTVYAVQIKEAGSFAVAEAYRNWRDLSRQEVVEMLRSSPRSTTGHDAS